MATSDVDDEGGADGLYDLGQAMYPEFRLASGTYEGRPCRNLDMQTFERAPNNPTQWISRPPEQWHRLAIIESDKIVMRPVHANPDAHRYLSHRHGPILTVIYDDGSAEALPESADEAVGQIDRRIPYRMFNECHEGSGFIKDLDLLWQGLARIGGVDTVVVSKSGTPTVAGRMVCLLEADVIALRRQFDRLKRVARDNTKARARWIVQNDLLSQLDSHRFPRMVIDPDTHELLQLERVGVQPSPAAARRTRRSTMETVRNNLPALAQEEPREVMQLHAEIERVALQRMIQRYEELLDQNLPEPRWQRFFEDNIFILKLVFARPVRLLHSQFHAQGSGLSGAGAQVGDFLLTEQGQALAIVEIKKPGTQLVGASYRNTQVFSPGKELAGAMTQVLVQQNEMRTNWHRHRGEDAALSESRSDVIRCVVIAGRNPTEAAHRRSFDIFRNACKDVDVLTFDELLGKLRLLRDHLSPPSPVQDNDVPF